MTIRTVLVPVRGDGKGEGVLDHALFVARPFNAHIDVVHCRPRPQDILPFGFYVPAALKKQIASSASQVADDEEQHLKTIFNAYCQRNGMEPETSRPWPLDRLSVSWREETGKMPDVVGSLGRLSDVIVIARPDPKANIGFNTLQGALFDAGRLVLICPPRKPEMVGRSIAIGWNGTTEGARAIAAALPVLRKASSAAILVGDIGERNALDAAALQDYLQIHEVTTSVHIFKSKETAVGQALLRESVEAGADSLLIGAYHHSLRRELVLGGVTQHIVENAQIPVWMAH
ncbi:MAG: universal stress protein [Geminicoccaceae bacterium]|nr:universal stress protein [Geminicoccaceae bacterium]